jgi:hypothetical protein
VVGILGDDVGLREGEMSWRSGEDFFKMSEDGGTSNEHRDMVGNTINTLDALHRRLLNHDDYEGATRALAARDDLLVVWRALRSTIWGYERGES